MSFVLLATLLAFVTANKHVVLEMHTALPARDWPDKTSLLASPFEERLIHIVQLADLHRSTRTALGTRAEATKKSIFSSRFFFFCIFF